LSIERALSTIRFSNQKLVDISEIQQKDFLMSNLPTHEELSALLSETWNSHSEFQEVYLKGVHDEMWAGWYAAYVIGRLGEITTPSKLTQLLEAVDANHESWTDAAAAHVLKALGEG
jgi:hypothetical protein